MTCLCPGPLRTPFLTRAGAQQVRLFKLLRKLPVDEVARSGWEAMKAGRTLCVPGIGTKAAIAVTRFVPRGLVLAIMARACSAVGSMTGGAEAQTQIAKTTPCKVE